MLVVLLLCCVYAYVDAYVARFSGFIFVLPCGYAYVASENQA